MTHATGRWVETTLAGFRAMGAACPMEAAGHWLSAGAALEPAAPHDPRRAASQTNAGAAHVLLRQMTAAEAVLADAERSWIRLMSRVATAEVSIPGHSSSFHFRLASQNLPAFQTVQRRRHTRQCEAGLAITRFNRLLAGAQPAAGDAIVLPLIALLSDILGAQSPEVRLLRASAHASPETVSARSLYADKAGALAARLMPVPEDPMDDWRAIEISVALTALLPPSLPADARDGFQGAPGIRQSPPPVDRSLGPS